MGHRAGPDHPRNPDAGPGLEEVDHAVPQIAAHSFDDIEDPDRTGYPDVPCDPGDRQAAEGEYSKSDPPRAQDLSQDRTGREERPNGRGRTGAEDGPTGSADGLQNLISRR